MGVAFREAIVIAVGVLMSPGLAGQVQVQASDGSDGDLFGWSVSVGEDFAVAGAPFDSDATSLYLGAAYVYQRSGGAWVEQVKLAPPSGIGSLSYFGSAVDLCEPAGLIAVGSGYLTDEVFCEGAEFLRRVHVYRQESSTGAWQYEAELASPNLAYAFTTGFGQSVSFSEDGQWLAVGAPFDDYICDPPPPGCPDCNSGAVHVFRFDGVAWSHFQTILAPDGATDDRFGKSVSVHGGVLVAGAWLADSCPNPALPDCGAAYVFRFDGTSWGFEQKLTAPDAFVVDRLGDSVSVQGDGILVGSRGSNLSPGAVYYYTWDGTAWSFVQKLTPSDGVNGDAFGWNIARYRTSLIVGAPFHTVSGVGASGAAYLFQWDGTAWVEVQKLVSSAPAQGLSLGFDVGIGPGRLMVGLPGDSALPWPGAALIY